MREIITDKHNIQQVLGERVSDTYCELAPSLHRLRTMLLTLALFLTPSGLTRTAPHMLASYMSICLYSRECAPFARYLIKT